MGRKVAIVGGADTRRLAPYADNTWEIWAFSSLRLTTPRITRWFEMHALEDLREQLTRDTPKRMSFQSYMAFLRELDVPVYMQAPILRFLIASATPLRTPSPPLDRAFRAQHHSCSPLRCSKSLRESACGGFISRIRASTGANARVSSTCLDWPGNEGSR